jgi:hypothetical protein
MCNEKRRLGVEQQRQRAEEKELGDQERALLTDNHQRLPLDSEKGG